MHTPFVLNFSIASTIFPVLLISSPDGDLPVIHPMISSFALSIESMRKRKYSCRERTLVALPSSLSRISLFFLADIINQEGTGHNEQHGFKQQKLYFQSHDLYSYFGPYVLLR